MGPFLFGYVENLKIKSSNIEVESQVCGKIDMILLNRFAVVVGVNALIFFENWLIITGKTNGMSRNQYAYLDFRG
jgi:hypothetical protein